MDVPLGTVFGSLTVICELERSGSNRRFLCQCACGRKATKFLGNLRAGRSTSCGCEYNWGEAGRQASATARRARAELTADGRRCHTCRTWKAWDHFRSDPRRPEGKASNCIECGRWRAVRLRYGLSRDEWEQIRAEQGGGCALCGDAGSLAVDHDHSCHKPERACPLCIRGLLCDFCNRVLGRIEQKPGLAARFADYLHRRPLS